MYLLQCVKACKLNSIWYKISTENRREGTLEGAYNIRFGLGTDAGSVSQSPPGSLHTSHQLKMYSTEFRVTKHHLTEYPTVYATYTIPTFAGVPPKAEKMLFYIELQADGNRKRE